MIQINEKDDGTIGVLMNIEFTPSGLAEFAHKWGEVMSFDGEVEWFKLDEFVKARGYRYEV